MRRKATTYGTALTRLMEEKGLSGYRLAQIAGVDASTLSYILSDQRQPRAETLERLLRAAGETWAWLDANMIAVELPAAE